jgi:hypothetical protein
MRTNIMIFIFFILLISLNSQSPAQNPERGLEYERETLFETKPWIAPYYLPLQYGQNSYHFEHKESGRLSAIEMGRDTVLEPLAPTVDYFWVLNSGKLIFMNNNQGIMAKGTLSLLDYKNGKWIDYMICDDYHNYFSNIWPGPKDELYFDYYSLKEKLNSYGLRFHLKKYDLNTSEWVTEPAYSQIAIAGPDEAVRIAPSGDVYIRSGESQSTPGEYFYKVFDSGGRFKDSTTAEGITSDSIAITFSSFHPKETGVHSIFQFNKDGAVQKKINMMIKENYDFITTFDGLVLIHSHWIWDRKTSDGKYFFTDLPLVMAIDPASCQSKEIHLENDADDKYKYYNVADIAINYKGEIYALFVYFNNPYRITGEELIVLYRWTRITDK